jgi:hypothetical protein
MDQLRVRSRVGIASFRVNCFASKLFRMLWHDWIRTSDLFRVKSPGALIRRRGERYTATRIGSVHDGLTRVRCLLRVTE